MDPSAKLSGCGRALLIVFSVAVLGTSLLCGGCYFSVGAYWSYVREQTKPTKRDYLKEFDDATQRVKGTSK